MEGIASEALKAAGPFPLVQIGAITLFLLVGVYMIIRGSKDSTAPRETVPQWLLIAPAHDLIDDVAEIGEHMRRQTKLLEKIEAILTRMEASLIACKVALELIRDESRLR